MGKIKHEGRKLLKEHGLVLDRVDRTALVLGTGWNRSDVLEAEGFVEQFSISFDKLGLHVGSGAGHANRFLLGTWGDEDVVISQGRVHMYQQLEVPKLEIKPAGDYQRQIMEHLQKLEAHRTLLRRS